MEFGRKRRGGGAFGSSGAMKKSRDESESFTTGVGSKSKPCTKFFRNVNKESVGFVQVAKIKGCVSCDLGHRFKPCALQIKHGIQMRKGRGEGLLSPSFEGCSWS